MKIKYNITIMNYKRKRIILFIIAIVLSIIVPMLIMKYFKETFDNDNQLSSAVIVGAARDIEKFIPDSFEKMEMIASLFKQSKIIIYENDSKDNTLEQLIQWQNNNNNVEIITEKNVPGNRTQRLAHARNTLLEKALTYNYDYLIVIDTDNANLYLTKEAILSSFNNDDKFPNWACIGANQLDHYYDMWALRTYDDWMPFDHIICIANTQDDNYCRASRIRKIDQNADPIKVKSCFGGLVIYKTKYIQNSRYEGMTPNNEETCEHVSFNLSILDNNKDVAIYINPKMINNDLWVP